jgi:hypothetical protein
MAFPQVPPAAEIPASDSILSSTTVDAKSQIINKHTLTWLIVVAVIVAITFTVITCLLCRCKRRRSKAANKKKLNTAGHSHHSSLAVTDGRNEHWAWNKNAPKPEVERVGTGQSGYSMTPLAKAAVKPAGYFDDSRAPAVHVVEEDAVSPLSPPWRRGQQQQQKTGSRYYSGFSNAWKRISQIGRAY